MRDVGGGARFLVAGIVVGVDLVPASKPSTLDAEHLAADMV